MRERIITEYAEVIDAQREELVEALAKIKSLQEIVDSVNKVKRYEEALDDILQNDGNGYAGEIAFKAINQEKDDGI